ncbi:MAG TPA: DMT family transporter [Symbiobacteriaceae bacterium]
MLDYLSMVLMAILWAGAFVAGKLSVSTVPPDIVAFLRFFIAGTVLVGIAAIWGKESLKLPRRNFLLACGLGLTGIAGYNLLFFIGLQYTPSSDGAMIIPTLTPVVTLFAAALLLGEALTQRKLLGAAISLGGQALIFWALLSTVAHDPARLKGDLIYLAAMFFWAAYGIIGRIAAKRFTPLGATTWGSITGTLMLLPFALWSFPGSGGYKPMFWADVVYLALGATVAGFFLWSRGLKILGASRSAVFMNMVPVFTVILAFLILGERPSWLQVAGMLVVLTGVYITQSGPAPAAVKAEVSA